jgi:hypothetical protein
VIPMCGSIMRKTEGSYRSRLLRKKIIRRYRLPRSAVRLSRSLRLCAGAHELTSVAEMAIRRGGTYVKEMICSGCILKHCAYWRTNQPNRVVLIERNIDDYLNPSLERLRAL